ncbi:BspA family leucine-rich repeat surface protein [Reichenbachiella ulvae]|uniref:BspA family leucine-rich repeat surface protein n=1 Tax=Reichenbachiella ulvae TaxID=2980104 RepID=A0ABT3CZD6_9BACT|nr:BspA family leucine-rich repeat surface protein [Reichenbachiella ulvae]MCV9388879.1 BspA family leucine-rich repeat surface protein [Reichenbachiella ulvae]
MSKYLRLLLALMLLTSYSTQAQDRPFITTWETTESNESITIPTARSGYSYTVDWGDGSTDETVYTRGATHSYEDAGIYTVSITGDFPRIYFNDRGSNKYKILTIEQWGDIEWRSMESAFSGCNKLTLSPDLSDTPDLSRVNSMKYMFHRTSSLINGNLNEWDVSNVTNMDHTFAYSAFNDDLSDWDVSKVTDMRYMFWHSSFNQDLSTWDVGNVTVMTAMFWGTPFNGDISNWDVSNVTYMGGMFLGTSFNGDISNWDVSNVTYMDLMFEKAQFNGDISNWDVSNVASMSHMFHDTDFNGDISSWDVSSVINMTGMFKQNNFFNQNISDWDVSSVTHTAQMFEEAKSFNQDLANWDISQLEEMDNMFDFSGMSNNQYDRLLEGWSTLDNGETQIPEGLTLGASEIAYCNGGEAREQLINDYGWTINDAGQECTSFITTWKTTTTDETITLPTTGTGYSYTVDWGDGSSDETIYAAGASHSYTDAGTYTVTISGDFPRIHFNNAGDKDKIQSVEQWGTGLWSSMEGAFYGCSNLIINASDAPNYKEVKSLSNAFKEASKFNATVHLWDVSNVTDMSGTFENASTFNQSLGQWDISQVTDMKNLFSGTAITDTNYDATLIGWQSLDKGESKIPSDIQLDASGLNYCAGLDARALLVSEQNWSIVGDNFDLSCRLENLRGKSGNENEEMSYLVDRLKEGYENTTLHYQIDAASLDVGMLLDENTGRLTWTPTEEDNGTYEVTITLSYEDEELSQVITITVNEINQAPELALTNQSVHALQTLNYTIPATDADLPANTLTYTLDQASLDLGMTLDASTGAFSWTPVDGQQGEYSVTVTVSDGTAEVSAEFVVTVDDVLAVASPWAEEVSLYPSPANEQFNLTLSNDYQGPITLRIINLSARVVMEYSFEKRSEAFQQIVSVDQLPAGTYILKLSTGNEVVLTQKVLKN